MKLMRISLIFMGFCFVGNSYAMENNKEQIVKDLSQAKTSLQNAENRAEVVDDFQKKIMEDIMRLDNEKQETIDLAQKAHDLSCKIVNDDLASPRTKEDAQSTINKAFLIVDKYRSKK